MGGFWRTYQQVSLAKVVYSQMRKISPKTRPKEGKNLPSELDNFRMIDFGEVLTLYVHLDGVSRIVLEGLFSKFKNFFQKWVSVRGGWVPKMAPRWLSDPVPNFFPHFFLTHRIWILYTLFVILDVFRSVPIDFLAKLRALEGGLWSLF